MHVMVFSRYEQFLFMIRIFVLDIFFFFNNIIDVFLIQLCPFHLFVKKYRFIKILLERKN